VDRRDRSREGVLGTRHAQARTAHRFDRAEIRSIVEKFADIARVLWQVVSGIASLLSDCGLQAVVQSVAGDGKPYLLHTGW
jgi:hypothetical protein